MEFDLSTKKLQKENQKRLNEIKRKREVEENRRKIQLEYNNQLQFIAEENRKKQEEIQLQKDHEASVLLAKTGGLIFIKDYLIPYLTEGDDDKIILPESYLAELNNQDAFSRGALFFEIKSSLYSNNITHCGVREFSATEGTIGLPIKVINSLLHNTNQSIDSLDTISIMYTRLTPIKTIKLHVHKDESIYNITHIKHVLEENLKYHSTLSNNDILSIWYRGIRYRLTVIQVLPEPYGTLLNTDVEVEFVDIACDSTTTATSTTSATQPTTSQPPVASSTQASISNTTITPTLSSSSSTLQPSVDTTPFIEYTVPAEPSPDSPSGSVIHVRIRIPSGQALSRKFNYYNDKVIDILHYICNYMHINQYNIQLTRTLSQSIQQIYSVPVPESVISPHIDNDGTTNHTTTNNSTNTNSIDNSDSANNIIDSDNNNIIYHSFDKLGMSNREMFVASLIVK